MIGIFLCLFLTKKLSEYKDDDRNNKDDDKNPESHSGFKNVSNNFATCK